MSTAASAFSCWALCRSVILSPEDGPLNTITNRKKLVVIGNGMAGARAVEEVLSRDRGRLDHVVFGGGLLGLEAARGLMTHGVEVSVLESAPHLMRQQLDAESGGMLARQMEGMGVRVLAGAQAVEVVGNGCVQGVRLADGETLPCE